MLEWNKVTLLLCAFGTLREIRPSEPFVSEFLVGEWRNITQEQLNRDVYPLGTYFNLALLVFVFLVTDFLRFKPVIILSGISGIAVSAILLWTTSLEWLQVVQFVYGLYMATEVAYYTYIYAQVDPAHYPKVSSYTRIAALTGRFLSGVSSQLLIHFEVMNYRDLNYITFTAQILATFWAFWLPPVQYGIYFHQRRQGRSLSLDKQLPLQSDKRTFQSDFVEASTLIAQHARSAYTRPKVLAWSSLYACSLALFLQVQIYVQLLWMEIQRDGGQIQQDQTTAYNGAVEAALTLFGAGGAFVASILTQQGLPAPVAAIQGVALFMATYIPNVFVSYAGYIVTGLLFHYTITLASAKIASQLSDDSCFGLIFGISTLLGMGLQSILTVVLIQSLELSIAAQYYCVSGLYLVLALGWLLGWMLHVCMQKRNLKISNSS